MATSHSRRKRARESMEVEGSDTLTVRVFCNERHMNHRIKAERIDFEGIEKIRFNCPHCHRDYKRLLTKWETTQATLLAAGIKSIALRNLERYG